MSSDSPVVGDTIYLTLHNRSDVVAWLIERGINAGIPASECSGNIHIHRPDGEPGMVMLGETLTQVGDLVMVGDTLGVGAPDGKTARDWFAVTPPATPHPIRDGLSPATSAAVSDAIDRAIDVMRDQVRKVVSPFTTPRPPATHTDLVDAGPGVVSDHGSIHHPPVPPARPVSPTPPDLPNRIRMIEPPETWSPRPGEIAVSLGGGIPGVEPWHDQAAELLGFHFVDTDAYRLGAGLAILCPRRRDFTTDPQGQVLVGGKPWTPAVQHEQVRWEWRHMRPNPGAAMFWFPASEPETVMPTSLLELGIAFNTMGIVVGAHPFYARRDILEHAAPHMSSLTLHTRLRDTVLATVALLNAISISTTTDH